jgi:hypothetical protein
MTNTHAKDRLRNLFVTLYELGVRESDGRYYLGVDNGPNKPIGEIDDPTGLTTEAGLFQSSWNYSYQNPLLKQLFKDYRNGKRLGFSATILPKEYYLSITMTQALGAIMMHSNSKSWPKVTLDLRSSLPLSL